MEFHPIDHHRNHAWNAILTPHFRAQPAWTRVPTKPRSSGSNLKIIMTRVSLLSQRHSAILSRLPPWPTLSIPNCFPNPRIEEDTPHKRARDETFLPSQMNHEFGSGRPDSEAKVAHDQCQARTDVANFHMKYRSQNLYPVYKSMRNGTYVPPSLTKRRHDMDCADMDIIKNEFRSLSKIMPIIEMAIENQRYEVDITLSAIAYQAVGEPQNTRVLVAEEGRPELSDISERTEPRTISVDTRSDPDIFVTALEMSPPPASPVAHVPEPAPISAPVTFKVPDLSSTTSSLSSLSSLPDTPSPPASMLSAPATEPVISPRVVNSPEAPAPAAVTQLAEAAGHYLDGNASSVVVEEGPNGRMFVRFKLSAEYAPLFPSASPKHQEVAILEDEDVESPSRAYMRDFIQRSKRKPLTPRSPNHGSPARQASPKVTNNPSEQASPEAPKTTSPTKVEAIITETTEEQENEQARAPTRRSSRLRNKEVTKSSIPTPIRVDSRSGAGRNTVKSAAPDVIHQTRANTRKNKGKAQYPAEVIAQLGEAAQARNSPVKGLLKADGKTVRWKEPVVEAKKGKKKVTKKTATARPRVNKAAA